MREVAFWRWIFGLALLPTAAWAWLITRTPSPDAHVLDMPLSLVVAYAGSLLLVGMLALAWFAIADFTWSFLRFFLWVIGVRPEP